MATLRLLSFVKFKLAFQLNISFLESKIQCSVVSKTIMALNSPVSPVETKKLTVQVLVFLRGSLVVFSPPPGNLRHFLLQISREGQTSTIICRT